MIKEPRLKARFKTLSINVTGSLQINVTVNCMQFCTGGRLADVINCAKFYLNQIRGFDSVEVEFLAFP